MELQASKINTKGLLHVVKSDLTSYERNRDLSCCDGRYIHLPLMDKSWMSQTSWIGIPIVMIAFGLFILWEAVADGGLSSFDPQGMFWWPMAGLVLGILWLNNIIRLFRKGPNDGQILFNRQTGTVFFDETPKTKSFEIPFELLDLYIIQVSAGKGLLFYKVYFVPQQFPKGVGKHQMYEAALEINSPEEAEWTWAAFCQFMDKSKPIPRHFYRWMQMMVCENQGVTEELPLDEDIKRQAPFYDIDRDVVLEKKVW